MFKNILKHFLWGKVGKYEIFFVTLQRNSGKGEIYNKDNIDNLYAAPTLRLVKDYKFSKP